MHRLNQTYQIHYECIVSAGGRRGLVYNPNPIPGALQPYNHGHAAK